MHNKHELASRINDDTANRCLPRALHGITRIVGEVEVGGGGGGGGGGKHVASPGEEGYWRNMCKLPD